VIAPENPLLSALLGLPALAYDGVTRLRNRHYDNPRNRRRVELPVISVGNITVGGTGKTPMVAWLAQRILDDGLRPAVVSRGYGDQAGRGPLLVSRGEGPLVGPEISGDEPHLLASSNPGLLVVVGSDRVAGAGLARELGAQVVLLDDGFQHRRLERDLDIVLLDASNPFGNYRMLPAGLLRESVRGLSRADVVVITRSGPDESFHLIERVIRNFAPEALLLRAGHRALGFHDAGGRPVETPARAVAFCGIGNPARFRADLVRAGVEVVEFRSFRDHRRYEAAELRELAALAGSRDLPLVTTEKDLVRIGEERSDHSLDSLLTFRIEAEVYEPQALIRTIHELLDSGERP
jgi:tetraacyldisaccharide 4'-kinase